MIWDRKQRTEVGSQRSEVGDQRAERGAVGFAVPYAWAGKIYREKANACLFPRIEPVRGTAAIS